MKFTENEIDLVYEFVYEIRDKIRNEYELSLLVNLLFTLNTLPEDETDVCIFLKHQVDPNDMLDKVLDCDFFDWFILYEQVKRIPN
jgi:hypothetical protein